MTEKLDPIEEIAQSGAIEEVERVPFCRFNSSLDCINESVMRTVDDVNRANIFCTNCLRSQLVRELKLLRVTG